MTFNVMFQFEVLSRTIHYISENCQLGPLTSALVNYLIKNRRLWVLLQALEPNWISHHFRTILGLNYNQKHVKIHKEFLDLTSLCFKHLYFEHFFKYTVQLKPLKYALWLRTCIIRLTLVI